MQSGGPSFVCGWNGSRLNGQLLHSFRDFTAATEKKNFQRAMAPSTGHHVLVASPVPPTFVADQSR